MSLCQPFGKLYKSDSMDAQHAEVRILIALVIAGLGILCRPPLLDVILGGMAFDLPQGLVGRSSFDNCFPSLFP